VILASVSEAANARRASLPCAAAITCARSRRPLATRNAAASAAVTSRVDSPFFASSPATLQTASTAFLI
jgi:hypothetical protein